MNKREFLKALGLAPAVALLPSLAKEIPLTVAPEFASAFIPTGAAKVISYVGNGTINGPFLYCGLRPTMILAKRADAPGKWEVSDLNVAGAQYIGLAEGKAK